MPRFKFVQPMSAGHSATLIENCVDMHVWARAVWSAPLRSDIAVISCEWTHSYQSSPVQTGHIIPCVKLNIFLFLVCFCSWYDESDSARSTNSRVGTTYANYPIYERKPNVQFKYLIRILLGPPPRIRCASLWHQGLHQ